MQSPIRIQLLLTINTVLDVDGICYYYHVLREKLNWHFAPSSLPRFFGRHVLLFSEITRKQVQPGVNLYHLSHSQAHLTPFRALCTMRKATEPTIMWEKGNFEITILCSSVDRTFLSINTEGKRLLHVEKLHILLSKYMQLPSTETALQTENGKGQKRRKPRQVSIRTEYPCLKLE